jgi:hypothetical protein
MRMSSRGSMKSGRGRSRRSKRSSARS